jgi:hypothetical protein
VSPFGVNILGGVTYINKVGRKQKLDQYGKGRYGVRYKWIQRALTDQDKAICECKIVENLGTDSARDLCDWVTGECSPASMKMSTLAGYQNHLAQTRAFNRAVEEAIGLNIHEEMLENLGKLQLTKGEKLPMIDTGVSPEEMNVPQNQKRNTDHAETIEQPEYECHECGNPMTSAEVNYSKKLYKKQICRDCQAYLKK